MIIFMDRTGEQRRFLINYMDTHQLFAIGQIMKLGCQGNVKYNLMWENLANELNSMGPTKKTVTQWKNKWSSMRKISKLKKAKYMTAFNRTGNFPPTVELNEEDQIICDIFGEYGVGLSVIEELGFYGLPKSNYNHLEIVIDTLDRTIATWKNVGNEVFQHFHQKYIRDVEEVRLKTVPSKKKKMDPMTKPALPTLVDLTGTSGRRKSLQTPRVPLNSCNLSSTTPSTSTSAPTYQNSSLVPVVGSGSDQYTYPGFPTANAKGSEFLSNFNKIGADHTDKISAKISEEEDDLNDERFLNNE